MFSTNQVSPAAPISEYSSQCPLTAFFQVRMAASSPVDTRRSPMQCQYQGWTGSRLGPTHLRESDPPDCTLVTSELIYKLHDLCDASRALFMFLCWFRAFRCSG